MRTQNFTAYIYITQHFKLYLSCCDPENYDGVVTNLKPDILECEVWWALGSIATNKVSGGDETPAELFQTLKDDADKMLHPICH